jgi:type III secretion system YscD/HrpQ family protein
MEPGLQVIGGLHAGVNLELDTGSYTIGSSTGADIVLRDANVAPEHAVIRVGQSEVRLEATGGEVEYDGGVLAQGHGCRLQYPVELTLGEAKIRLTGQPDRQAVAAARFGKLIQTFVSTHPAAAGFAVLLGAAVLSFGAASLPHSSEQGPSVTRPKEQTSKPDNASVTEEAAVQFKRRLQDAKITGVKVSASGNILAVSGRVSKTSMAGWNSALKWLDETYGSKKVVLSSTVEFFAEDGKDPVQLRLQSVWFGEKPYIILEDGTHYHVGALLDNGWTVKEIGEDKVVLARGDQTFPISYR